MCHLCHFAEPRAGGRKGNGRKAFVSFTRSETTWTGRPNKPKSNGGNQKATAQIDRICSILTFSER